jgi:inositol transport system ATP-binding protein
MAEATGHDAVLEIRNLSKSFPGVRALDGVWLDVRRGSVHALMGENGAGKSTLMKTILGLHAPDGGQIILEGRPVRIRSPHEALRLGISMVHQELLPFADLTVAENILMGQEPTRWLPGWLDRRAMSRRAETLLDRLGVKIPPWRRMRELSAAQMQIVEIAKALAYDARVILMDEPTSAISRREVESLFEVIRDLRRRGVAVIYVSHKMDEVFRIADRISVLRDGRHVGTSVAGQLDSRRLIALMVGRELDTSPADSRSAPGDVVLEVRELTRGNTFRRISFQIRRGEILGIAGLMGAGRTELARALFGLAPADSGRITIHGRPAQIRSPRDAISQGIALVAEDRQADGLVPRMSVKHNLTLASLKQCCRGPLIDQAEENRVADEQIRAFGIRARDREQRVDGLSGGNQQKVVLAKSLLTNPSVLILDEPTRGIDIGAKIEFYSIISRLAREGKAILLISSELPELLWLSHRLLVMREGAIAAELDPRRTTQEEILHHAMPC